MDDRIAANDIDEILQAGGDYLFPQPNFAEPADSSELKPPVAPGDLSEEPSDESSDEALETAPEETSVETPQAPTLSGMKSLHPDELPREKAMKFGMNALTDVELLAILLGSGIKGKSVLDFAREILRDNGNRLSVLSRKPIPELIRKYKGLGAAKATLLSAAMTFGQRAQADMKIADRQISSSNSVYEYMRDKLERNNHEEFWVLHLSRANRVMAVEQLSKGGLAATAVDVKLIAKSAIDHLSSGIIVCHNHPSGNMAPSPQDDRLTHNIIETCKVCDIKVLDHLIIGPTGYYSYQDEGRLR